MNQYKWHRKVKEERERNKAKQSELLAKFYAPPPPPPTALESWFNWDDLVVKPIVNEVVFFEGSITVTGSTLNGYSESPVVTALAELVPAIRTHVAECPDDCETMKAPLAWLVVHLNDQHRWTRESIADWLDSLDIDLTIQPRGLPNADAGPSETDRAREAILAAYGLTGAEPGFSLT